jgi:hypothetical protein
MQVRGVPGMDRPEEDARSREPILPYLEDPSRDGHARVPLGTEIKVEDEVLEALVLGNPDGVFGVRRGVELGGRPALRDPGAHLSNGVGRVVRDENSEKIDRTTIALGPRSRHRSAFRRAGSRELRPAASVRARRTITVVPPVGPAR